MRAALWSSQFLYESHYMKTCIQLRNKLLEVLQRLTCSFHFIYWTTARTSTFGVRNWFLFEFMRFYEVEFLPRKFSENFYKMAAIVNWNDPTTKFCVIMERVDFETVHSENFIWTFYTLTVYGASSDSALTLKCVEIARWNRSEKLLSIVTSVEFSWRKVLSLWWICF